MKKKHVEIILTPREVAEWVLGHHLEPRSARTVRNFQKRIQKACREYENRAADWQYFGLPCDRDPRNSILIKKSEAKRWADRLRLWRWEEVRYA
jgi:hypothetical protein